MHKTSFRGKYFIICKKNKLELKQSEVSRLINKLEIS